MVVALAGAAPAAAELPGPVARALRAAGVDADQVGLRIEPLTGREPRPGAGAAAPIGAAATVQVQAQDDDPGGLGVVSHQDGLPLNPASTIKVLTTQAALALLGPDYRWRTTWLAAGRVAGGVLRGDLVMRGGGDPKLVIEDLTEQVAQLRARGIDAIEGDLVLDDSLWDVPRETEPFDGDASQPYNVGPNAAMMNFKAVRVSITPLPAAVSARPAVALDPPLAGVEIENDVTLTIGPCRMVPAGPSVRDAGRDDAPPGIRVGGRWPAACGTQALSAAVLTHRQFDQALFAAAWRAAGGQWSGRARWGRAPRDAQVLLEWWSPRTLAEVVRDVNKFSNNLMAASLLLQIGAERAGAPGTVEAGARIVRDWLARAGLPMPELVLDNGSGLSRVARISAASMVALLRRAAEADSAGLLQASLPQVGIDGTMARRLRDEPVAGNAWIKSGSLSDVRSAAGYVVARSGRRYAVAMLINGPRAEAASGAIDALLRWVYDNG